MDRSAPVSKQKAHEEFPLRQFIRSFALALVFQRFTSVFPSEIVHDYSTIYPLQEGDLVACRSCWYKCGSTHRGINHAHRQASRIIIPSPGYFVVTTIWRSQSLLRISQTCRQKEESMKTKMITIVGVMMLD